MGTDELESAAITVANVATIESVSGSRDSAGSSRDERPAGGSPSPTPANPLQASMPWTRWRLQPWCRRRQIARICSASGPQHQIETDPAQLLVIDGEIRRAQPDHLELSARGSPHELYAPLPLGLSRLMPADSRNRRFRQDARQMQQTVGWQDPAITSRRSDQTQLPFSPNSDSEDPFSFSGAGRQRLTGSATGRHRRAGPSARWPSY